MPKILKNLPSEIKKNKLKAGIFLGLSAYYNMPREDFPEIKETKIYISTVYPGNTAEDIERQTLQLRNGGRSGAGEVEIEKIRNFAKNP